MKGLTTLERQTQRDQELDVCRMLLSWKSEGEKNQPVWHQPERHYLQEMDVVLCVGQFVQFGLILLQLGDLLLDLVQQLLGLTDGRLFLGFDQLPDFKALQLDRPDQLGEDGVCLLGCHPSRALEGDTKQTFSRRRLKEESRETGKCNVNKMSKYERLKEIWKR